MILRIGVPMLVVAVGCALLYNVELEVAFIAGVLVCILIELVQLNSKEREP